MRHFHQEGAVEQNYFLDDKVAGTHGSGTKNGLLLL